MSTRQLLSPLVAVALLAPVLPQASAQTPLGTTFTYQGQLKDQDTPATGFYDMEFTLWDALTSGNQIGSADLRTNVAVTQGLFTVYLNSGGEFGPQAFNGDRRFLQIAVGPVGGSRTPLSPRQPLTPIPYALQLRGVFVDENLNVGIGTGTPTEKLHVASGNAVIRGPDNFAAGTEAQLTLGDGNNYVKAVWGEGVRLGAFQAIDGFVLKNGGNVGIGTTNPQAKLHLAGTAGVDGIMFPDGTLQTTAGGGSGGLTLPYSGSVSSMLAAFNVSNTGTGYGLQGTATGNAAVYGETSSANSGHPGVWGKSTGAGPGVAGTAAGGSLIGVMGSSSGSGAGTGVYGLTPSSTGKGVFGEATTTSGVNYGVYGKTQSASGYAGYFEGRGYFSGNVGIGTTAPQQKLHVAGISQFDLGTGTVSISTPGGNPGVIAFAPNGHRRDIVFDNSGIRLLVGDSASAPSVGVDIYENGRTKVKTLEITGGSDLSEQFNVAAPAGTAEPGMVVCIDPKRPGELIVSAKAYDRTVAGVISGAGGVKPGMLMGQKGSTADGEHPIALTGRVYCWADAANGAIIPGDLLTTSDLPGHAMKVTDHSKAQGAILGKAMTALSKGQGLVLVLVALQ